MSFPKPGQLRQARQDRRAFHNAMRGAPFWAIRPNADLEALHNVWQALGLEVA